MKVLTIDRRGQLITLNPKTTQLLDYESFLLGVELDDKTVVNHPQMSTLERIFLRYPVLSKRLLCEVFQEEGRILNILNDDGTLSEEIPTGNNEEVPSEVYAFSIFANNAPLAVDYINLYDSDGNLYQGITSNQLGMYKADFELPLGTYTAQCFNQSSLDPLIIDHNNNTNEVSLFINQLETNYDINFTQGR